MYPTGSAIHRPPVLTAHSLYVPLLPIHPYVILQKVELPQPIIVNTNSILGRSHPNAWHIPRALVAAPFITSSPSSHIETPRLSHHLPRLRSSPPFYPSCLPTNRSTTSPSPVSRCIPTASSTPEVTSSHHRHHQIRPLFSTSPRQHGR